MFLKHANCFHVLFKYVSTTNARCNFVHFSVVKNNYWRLIWQALATWKRVCLSPNLDETRTSRYQSVKGFYGPPCRLNAQKLITEAVPHQKRTLISQHCLDRKKTVTTDGFVASQDFSFCLEMMPYSTIWPDFTEKDHSQANISCFKYTSLGIHKLVNRYRKKEQKTSHETFDDFTS